MDIPRSSGIPYINPGLCGDDHNQIFETVINHPSNHLASHSTSQSRVLPLYPFSEHAHGNVWVLFLTSLRCLNLWYSNSLLWKVTIMGGSWSIIELNAKFSSICHSYASYVTLPEDIMWMWRSCFEPLQSNISTAPSGRSITTGSGSRFLFHRFLKCRNGFAQWMHYKPKYWFS